MTNSEASRLTPETYTPDTLRQLALLAERDGWNWAPLLTHAEVWERQLADSGKETAELREQLRAYRAAERIAHDNLEALDG